MHFFELFKLTQWDTCRAGELSAAELENLMVIVANPRQFKIPDWFLNRKKDYKDGRYSQVVSNALDMKLRDDLERLKKIRFAIILVWMELLLELQLNWFHSFKAMGLKLKLISLFSFVICAYITGFLELAFICYSFVIGRNHRGLRHYWGLRVRGQHTKTTGRRGKTVGVSKKR